MKSKQSEQNIRQDESDAHESRTTNQRNKTADVGDGRGTCKSSFPTHGTVWSSVCTMSLFFDQINFSNHELDPETRYYQILNLSPESTRIMDYVLDDDSVSGLRAQEETGAGTHEVIFDFFVGREGLKSNCLVSSEFSRSEMSENRIELKY